MKISSLLKYLLSFYAPGIVDDEGGGAVDRGDDFTPTEDEDDEVKPAERGEGKDEPEPERKGEEDEGGEKDEKGEEEEPKAKPKTKDSRIPLARHKEILDREREQRSALEKELAAFKQGKQVAATNEEITRAEDDLLKLEKDYARALTDGETDKAAELMTKIRRTERGIIETKAELATQAAEARAYERVRYDTTLERLEAAYPQINEDHEDFDKVVAAEVLELKQAYQLKGYSPADALKKAAKVMLGAATTRQTAAVDSEVRVAKEDVAAALAADRAKKAREKVAAAAGATPPSTARVGMDSDKAGGVLSPKDVMKMSNEEFSKLDEKTLAKMRGDEVA